jgi:hypothetical protein
MDGGLFITLYDEETLVLYLHHGVYGFLMKPVFENQPRSRSKHYDALADYACSREGTHVFFFLKRKIVYGGTVKGSQDFASFYLNGNTSPYGRAVDAPLFWDESSRQRYSATGETGVFTVNDTAKSQPYILLFDLIDEMTGKYITSDDLYFELGKFPYPLPSNSIQGMSFCTLTPGETETALELCRQSPNTHDCTTGEDIILGADRTLFNPELLELSDFINEAHLEFTLLADIEPLRHLLEDDSFVLCRQVPISPFKPFQMDRADICMYSINRPILNGTIPNVIIELKKERANFHAYNQMLRYLKWLARICKKTEFETILPIIIAPSFYVNRMKIEHGYEDRIVMYALDTSDIYKLPD